MGKKQLFHILIIFFLLLLCNALPIIAQSSDIHIIDAVKSNHLALVKQLISNGSDVNVQDENGATVLMWAVYSGNLEMVKYLVSKNADCNKKGLLYLDNKGNKYYGSLLSIAVAINKLSILKFLIEQCKIDVDDKEYNPLTKKSDGWTALQWSVYGGMRDIEKYLIEKGANEELCFEQKAFQYYENNEYVNASLYFEKAIPIIEKESGKNEKFAKALLYAAICFNQIGRLKKAHNYNLASYLISKNLKDLKTPLVALSCYNLAVSYYEFGNYKNAELLFLEARNLYQNLSQKEPANYAACCYYLGKTYYSIGKYAIAETFHIESINIREKILGKKNWDYASSCDDLGSLYEKIGKYDKAEDLYTKAVYFRGELSRKNHPKYASSCFKLGELYLKLGKEQKAEPFFKEAERVYVKNKGNNTLSDAENYNNLARIYLNSLDYKNAELYYLKAKSIRENILGEQHSEYATSCYHLAMFYNLTSIVNKADTLCTEAKQIKEKVFGKEHADYAASCELSAAINFKRGLEATTTKEQKIFYEKAEKLYLEAVGIYKNLFGLNHPDYASVCNNYGVLIQEMSRIEEIYTKKLLQYKDALSLYSEAKQVRKNVFGEEHPSYLETCNHLASLYAEMDNYAMAERLFLEVRSTSKKKYGPNHADYITGCCNLAELYFKMGNQQKAETFYLEAKNISEKTNGNQTENYIKRCNKLAEFYCFYGEYQSAEPLLIEVKSIVEKLHGKANYNYALSCIHLADLYADIGNYLQAEHLYSEAKKIIEKTFGKQHSHYANINTRLGILYAKTGSYEKSEQLLTESQKLEGIIHGKYHVNHAASYNDLATLHLTMGNLQKAESSILESNKIYEIVLGKYHVDYALSCNKLAELYSKKTYYVNSLIEKQNIYKKIEELYSTARIAIEIMQGKQNEYYASNCNNLAALYFKMGKISTSTEDQLAYFKKTEKLYTESIEINEKLSLKKYQTIIEASNNLALVYHTLVNFAQTVQEKSAFYQLAETYFLKSKSLNEKVYGKMNMNFASISNNLATLYLSMENSATSPEKKTNACKNAEKFYLESNQIIDSLAQGNLKFINENEREKYLNNEISDCYDAFYSFAVAGRSQERKLIGNAYNNALVQKGLLFYSPLLKGKMVLETGNKNLIAIDSNINTIRKILADQYNLPICKRRTEIKELEDSAVFWEKELKSFASEIPGLQKYTYPIKWQDIQKTLKEDETAIEFIKFRYHNGKEWTDSTLYYAIVLRKEYENPKAVFLFEEKQLQKLLTKQKNEIDSAFSKRIYSFDSPESDSLYCIVFKPITSYLNKVKSLNISPIGILNQVAFDAIPCNSSNERLSDKYIIYYTSSTAQCINRKELYQNELKSAALWGGIKYDMSINTMLANSSIYKRKTGITEKTTNTKLAGIITMYNAKNNFSWNYNDGSLNEVKTIQKLLSDKGINGILYSNLKGCEEQFKKLEDDNISMLHVSSNGYYFPDVAKDMKIKGLINNEIKFTNYVSPLLRSGLVLSGGNLAFKEGEVPEEAEDGVLTAQEISHLNLSSTQLVVLSTLQTSFGDVNSDEGIHHSLIRGLKMAGIDYLLYPLWHLSDEQKNEFMKDFYNNLFSGMEIKEAFKKTQNSMKIKYNNGKEISFAWAAFVLMN